MNPIFVCFRYEENHYDATNYSNRLLIYSRYRSGSSFTGSLFSHNPNIFYIFEPMKFVEYSTVPGDLYNKTNLRVRVKQIFQCVFEPMISVSTASGWVEKTFCGHNQYKPCDVSSPSVLEQQCSHKVYRVSKDIAIPSLQHLLSDADQPEHQRHLTNILHLVRDPRGVFESRVKISSGTVYISDSNRQQDLADVIAECKKNVVDIRYVIENNLTKHYYLLRYEDLSVNTTSLTKQLYNLLQFPYHEDVNNWIKKCTHAKQPSELSNEWSLYRQSRVAPYLWVRYLPLDIIRKIEGQCQEMMELLGYKPLPAHVRKHKEINLISKNFLTGVDQYIKYVLIS